MFLKVSEFAASQGVSASTVRGWIKQGMPSQPGPGGAIVLDPEAAEAWLDDNDDDDDGCDGDLVVEVNEPDDEEDGDEAENPDGDDGDDDDGDDDEA